MASRVRRHLRSILALSLPPLLAAQGAIAAPAGAGGPAGAAPATRAAVPPGKGSVTSELLRSARMWDFKNRPDLAQASLEKLLLVMPGHPDALALLGQMELKNNRPEVARKLLQQLQRDHPGHPATQELATAERIAGRDRRTMASIRLMVRAGRSEEAAVALRQLFPDGPPRGELGIEYYRVVGGTAKGWEEARTGLERLQKQAGDDPRVEFALAQHYVQRPATLQKGVRMLAAMIGRPDSNRLLLIDAYRRAIGKLPDVPANAELIRLYLQLVPGDKEITARLALVQRVGEERTRIARDPALSARRSTLAKADRGLEQASLAELETLLAKQPRDAEVLGTIGLLHFRQGRYPEAIDYLDRALAVARSNRDKWQSLRASAEFWRLVRSAGVASDRGDLAAAERDLMAALKLKPNDPDAGAALAGVYRDRGDVAGAERLYRLVLQVEPDNGSALRGLAGILAASGRRGEALALIDSFRNRFPKAAAKAAPLQAGLLRDEADALLAAGRLSKAMQTLETAVLLAPDEAWVRYDLARLYARLGLPRLAEAVMAEGGRRQPEEPAMAYATALVEAAIEHYGAALAALARIPAAARTSGMRELEQRAQVELRLLHASAAQADGDRELTARWLALAEKAVGDASYQIAAIAAAWFDAGDQERGIAILRAYLDRGLGQPAATPPQPQSEVDLKAARLRLLGLLNQARRDEELQRWLPELQARADWAPEERRRLHDVAQAVLLRQADALRAGGQLPAAEARLRAWLREHPHDQEVLASLARLVAARGDARQAVVQWRQLVAAQPGDRDYRFALVRALRTAGDPAGALAEAAQLAADIPPEALDDRLALVRLYLSLDQLPAARATIDALAATHPAEPGVLLHLGRVAAAEKNYRLALRWFHLAKAAEADRKVAGAKADGLPAAAALDVPESLLAELEPEDAGAEHGRHGRAVLDLKLSHGVTSGTERPLPAEGRWPVPAAPEVGFGRLKLDDELAAAPLWLLTRPFLVDAGTGTEGSLASWPRLPAALAEPIPGKPAGPADEEIARIEARRQPVVAVASEVRTKPGDPGISALRAVELVTETRIPIGYEGHAMVHVDQVYASAGTLPAVYRDASLYGGIQAAGPAASLSESRQQAHGTAVGIGYESDDWRFDLGTTPLGFLVRDWVGGIKHSGEVAGINYGFDVARRPLNSSLVSYAGVRDPASGRIWGGIRATGADLRLSKDIGPFGVFGTVGFHHYTGRNVPDNQRLSFRGGADWTFINRPDDTVNAAAVVTLWRYRENQRYYTFGHGGYYSPQHYLSLAFPVQWTGRWGRWAYLLRGNVSVSRTYEKAVPFHPTDAALQAAAERAPLPGGFDAPVYEGGHSRGSGRAFTAAFEYRLSPHLVLGGRFEVDRAAFYSPNNFLLYLRRHFSPQAEPIRYPPSPVRPYAQF